MCVCWDSRLRDTSICLWYVKQGTVCVCVCVCELDSTLRDTSICLWDVKQGTVCVCVCVCMCLSVCLPVVFEYLCVVCF